MSDHRRVAQTALWTVVGGLAVAYLTVLLSVPGTRTAVVVDDVGNLAAPLFAGACCLWSARRLTGRMRRCWLLLGAWALTWAGGQAAWVTHEVVLGQQVPFPGLPDVGYVAAAPLAILALLVHPGAPTILHGRVRLLLDAVLVSAGLLLLTWHLVLRDAYVTTERLGPAQVLGLGYPVLDVVVLSVLLLLLGNTRRGDARPLLLVAGGMLLGVAGHLVYGVLAQSGTWLPGNPVDAAWGIGFLLVAAGAQLQRSAPAEPQDRPAPSPSVLSAALPLAPALLAIASSWVQRLQGRLDRFTLLLMFVIVLILMLRQVWALLENGRLYADLGRLVDQRTVQLRTLAETDPLTGLPNRTVLFARIDEALCGGSPVGVALLDLDGFKAVNDSRGHAAGDELLRHVAERLSRYLPAGWTAARLGGDEFAIVLVGELTPEQALQEVRRLLSVVCGTVSLAAGAVEVSASLGIVLAVDGDTPEDLLRNADVAMYAAKQASRTVGRDGVEGTGRVFVPAMREVLLARVSLEAQLRSALDNDEVVPWFQPVVELESGRVTSFEALARWRRADGTDVSPGDFVPMAEECGLVTRLGHSILHAACRTAGEWYRAAARGELSHAPSLSVNVSAVQLADDGLVDDVRAALQAAGLPPQMLVIEITETALVRDPVLAGQRLAALRALGVRVALDDFGTGYSALGALQRMPVDIIKIDRAFVRDIHLGPRQAALATAVLSLAGSLHMSVVAEGVELAAQAERLLALGCPMAQGFLWSRAVPAASVLGLLASVPAPRVGV